ncbi:CocE/NonD family hydrolase [Marivirga sp.]|uniref:CocE/NonD family hydrolase n=1 Tax=Marivirga sp. TaxID=2018662 RepID=UPI0025E6653B|nr:CocE/NonD family hydrolase [Marivirga sp.]
MKKHILLFIGLCLFLNPRAWTQEEESSYVKEHYNKEEVYIPMRDGTRLYTAIYTPKEKGNHPIMMQRTCYSIAPYGPDAYKRSLGPSQYLMEDKFIFVYQDVRGRWMSEGKFTNMTPNIPGNKHKKEADESSDTFDTIEWLLKHLKGKTNGKVGQWGISYPGFYTAAALPDAHPALKASSPQAPIGDFFFDDFHHNGAYLQSYTAAYPVFGYQTKEPTTESWYREAFARMKTANAIDGYDYHMELGPLKNITEKIHFDNEFWQQTVEHPNYDEFWQKRSIIPHLDDIDHAVMVVGGWFDAEDLYGPLNIYKTIEKTSPDAYNTIVFGPWSHGDWARERGFQAVNHVYFGDSISIFYQTEIERTFFNHFLRDGEGKPNLPEAYMFDTGLKEWQKFDVWPPQIPQTTLGFAQNGKLLINEEGSNDDEFSYVSDPAKPVPYTSFTESVTFTPRPYMTDDQRHAARRPDVLVWESDPLEENLTLAGEIAAKLKVAISSTDADFIVKIIDVYPGDHESYEHNPDNIVMGNYQQLVRAEVFRGRFRDSFADPKPFIPNEEDEVDITLQDILHTFKKGHKVMVQIHSTWFPYIDRNPQKYVENIYKAEEEDFIKATITVKGDSKIEIGEIETTPQSLQLELDK